MCQCQRLESRIFDYIKLQIMIKRTNKMFVKIVVFLCLIGVVFGADNKLSDTLKNMTQTKNSSSTQGDENTLKTEIKQYLRECGANLQEDINEDYGNRFSNNRSSDGSRNRNYNNQGNNFVNNDGGNRKNYGANRHNGRRCAGNNNYEDNYENCNDRSNGNRIHNHESQYNNQYNQYDNNRYGRPSANLNSNQRGNYRSCNYGNSEDSNNGYDNGGSGYTSNRGSSSSRGNYDTNYGEYNYGNDNSYGPYGSSSASRRSQGGRNDGRTGNQDRTNGDLMFFRTKRASDDAQCISQCVFGYLDVLDDNRVPSETLLIKWLQDHLTNDLRRIRALREARRCFARLATTDTDDGCEFSKALSNCLDLEIE